MECLAYFCEWAALSLTPNKHQSFKIIGTLSCKNYALATNESQEAAAAAATNKFSNLNILGLAYVHAAGAASLAPAGL